MNLNGISHVMLTVTSIDKALWFWGDVMDLDVVTVSDTRLICIDRNGRVGIACRTHDDTPDDFFDERRVGLDHLAFRVADLDALRQWEARFETHDVPYTPIQESEWGWHLNVRAPEMIAIELEVTKPDVATQLFGDAPGGSGDGDG